MKPHRERKVKIPGGNENLPMFTGCSREHGHFSTVSSVRKGGCTLPTSPRFKLKTKRACVREGPVSPEPSSPLVLSNPNVILKTSHTKSYWSTTLFLPPLDFSENPEQIFLVLYAKEKRKQNRNLLSQSCVRQDFLVKATHRLICH